MRPRAFGTIGATVCALGVVTSGPPTLRAATAIPAQSGRPESSLDGDWAYRVGDFAAVPESIPAGLPKMHVPSNWYTQGLDHAGVVWFFRDVTLDAPMAHAFLRFGAVDYAASVYWDGRLIGEHRGYFAPFRAEIGAAGAGGHVLAVRVDSPNETKEAWSLHKTLIKGVLAHHDTRPGGAWSPRGQDANTGGIWGSVHLSDFVNAAVDEVRVSTLDANPEQAVVRIRVSAPTVATTSRLDYVVRDADGVIAASGTLGRLAASATRDTIETTLPLKRPRLWWPREFGSPHLYRLDLRLTGPEGTDVSSHAFAVRSVARDEQHRFSVNGRPIFLRGTNYIGSLYYGSFGAEAVRRDLELMVAANVNAVRVHAHVASPDLYKLADELGLLVWQDFPLQWGYEESDAFTREATRQATEMVSSLYNHPSIIFWSGDNEAPWSSDWMAWKYSDYDPDQNRSLDRALTDTLAREDPTRPSQGNAHPAEHAWSGWYTGTYRDFALPSPQPVLTEFGAQAVPELATLRTFIPDDQLWPLEGKNLDMWEYHNFQLHELRDIAKVPLGRSVQELIANTQAYQAKLTKFAAENLRRQKWQPVTGIFQFMFVEHWASMNWGVVDYLRRPKPAYGALARAYQPLLVVATAEPGGQELALHVVNDAEALHGARLVVSYYPSSAAPDRGQTLEIPGGDVLAIAKRIPAPGAKQALYLAVRDERGRVLSANDYAPGYFAP